MAKPSEVLDAVFTDLSAIAAICSPTSALDRKLPAPGSSISMVVGWPELAEDPSTTQPGANAIRADIGIAFRFPFLCGYLDQSQGNQGASWSPSLLQSYDTGSRLRALFYGACKTREIGYSVVVGRIAQNPPAATGAMQTFGGVFELIVRVNDDSHLFAYSPQSGGQPGQRP